MGRTSKEPRPQALRKKGAFRKASPAAAREEPNAAMLRTPRARLRKRRSCRARAPRGHLPRSSLSALHSLSGGSLRGTQRRHRGDSPSSSARRGERGWGPAGSGGAAASCPSPCGRKGTPEACVLGLRSVCRDNDTWHPRARPGQREGRSGDGLGQRSGTL
ncbi:uncharacterized protein ACOB8E_022712 [Sarcophilus harrisii]